MINLQRMENNIIILSFENKEAEINIINEAFITHLETLVEEIIRDNNASGLIFTSSHKEFIRGADYNFFLSGERTPQDIFKLSQRLQKVFRDFELWQKPVVAALNGNCLGWGMELALACQYRLAIHHHTLKFGFSDIKMGLIPCGGATQRLPRLLGIKKALPILLDGHCYSPLQAKELGLIDELVETKSGLIEKAIAFIEQNQGPTSKPSKGQDPYRATAPEGQAFFSQMSAKVQKDYRRFGIAPQKILNCLYEGSFLDLETACEIESLSFAELFQTKGTQRILQTLFNSINQCKGTGLEKVNNHKPLNTIGIVGTGLMGRGIAQALAHHHLQILLVDKDLSTAEMGRNLIQKETEISIAHIESSENYSELAKCDLIIEAIHEDLDQKRDLLSSIEDGVNETVPIITSTSFLSIADLNKEMRKPERLVGLHFFAPVSDSPLVEVIKGKETHQGALISALKLVNTIDKIPIIIRDGHGFFTTRIMVAYIIEALRCLVEGVTPALIENAGFALGFPHGPLAHADQISLITIEKLLQQKIKRTGQELIRESPEQQVLALLLKFTQKYDRYGLAHRKGFYDYGDNDEKELSQLVKEYQKEIEPKRHTSFEDIKKRLFNIQLVETMKCYEEGILNTAYEGDVASLLGWGFPSDTGGVVSACHNYGNDLLYQELKAMASQWGERFSPPRILKILMNKNYSSLHEAREILADALLEES